MPRARGWLGRRGSVAAVPAPARLAGPRRRSACRPRARPPPRSGPVLPVGAQMVDGAVARDRDQPGHRTAEGGIKSCGLTPNRHVDLLQHILGFATLTQDTQADSKKLRRGQPIDSLQRPAVAAAYCVKGGGYEFAVVVEVHGRPVLGTALSAADAQRVSDKRTRRLCVGTAKPYRRLLTARSSPAASSRTCDRRSASITLLAP